MSFQYYFSLSIIVHNKDSNCCNLTLLGCITFPRPFLHITLQYLKRRLATPFYVQCKIQVRLKNEKNDWKEKTFTQTYIVACLIICSRFAEQCISNTLKSTLSSIHVQTSTKFVFKKLLQFCSVIAKGIFEQPMQQFQNLPLLFKAS